MELVYSTGDIEVANRLSSALTSAGISNYISGTRAADLLGFGAGRTPTAISVWIHNSDDVENAVAVMLKIGYILPTSNEPAPSLKHNRFIVIIVIAGAMLLMAIVLGSVP